MVGIEGTQGNVTGTTHRAGVTVDNKLETQNTIVSPLDDDGDVSMKDQNKHSHIVGSLLMQVVGIPQSLASSTTVDSYDVEMSAGHTFVAGDEILIAEADASFQAEVLSVLTNTLTLDSPLDNVYTTSAIVFEVTSDMAVDGSTTAEEFSIELGSGATISFDITGIRFVINDASAMDDGTFGGIAALTNGVVFQVEHTHGNHTLWNAKTNGKLGLVMDNREYTSKAPAGEYGYNCTWKVNDDNGVVIRLSAGEKIKLIIQDDLTALSSFQAWVYGHRVAD